MEGDTVLYDGRIVSKVGFRVYVYGPNNQTRLVNTYSEYESAVSSGIWFPTKKDVPEKIEKPKLKGEKE